MDNFKYGFLRTAKTKNAKNFPWLKRFNNDFFSHTFYAKPIEWKKETIDDLFKHIDIGTFGRKFTLADFLKDYKPVLWRTDKNEKVEVLELDIIDTIQKQFSEHVEENHLNKEFIEVIEDVDGRAYDRAQEYLGKSKEDDYASKLQHEWNGKLVKTKDGKVCKITWISVCENSYCWLNNEIHDLEVICECEEDDNVTFTLEYAKDNLVEKENEVELL